MNNILKQILEFIEKHSKFIRKLIIFTIIYFVICVVNNSSLIPYIQSIFGEYIAIGVQAVAPTILISSEV